MDVIISQSAPLKGTVTPPPDKAICHRAVLIASCATGETAIEPWPAADDCQRTLQLVQGLGVLAERSNGRLLVHGRGLDGLCPPKGELFCGESGTTLRLAAGVLAGQPFTSTLSAGPSLSRRPMRRIIEPLSLMGARVESAAPRGRGEVAPPLVIHGVRPLRAIEYALPVASAQVKSAILLAGLFAQGRTSVRERGRTRDHTERMLQRFGARVGMEGLDISVDPGELASPGAVVLPGDFSSAAFFIVAASCVPGSVVTLRGVGLNPTRTALLRVLRRMGASLTLTDETSDWEPRGTLAIEACQLQGTELEAEEIPGLIDELPILMVAAACARGTTRFAGIGELRVKETDRIASMVSGLEALGVRVRVLAADSVEVEGTPMRGGKVASAQDHRTAMSLAVAGLVARGATTIAGAECVGKSFPDFFEQLRQLTSPATVKAVDKGPGLC